MLTQILKVSWNLPMFGAVLGEITYLLEKLYTPQRFHYTEVNQEVHMEEASGEGRNCIPLR